MAGEFNAGSVLVELKAQYSDLKKNVQGAKSEVTGFGSSVDATAKSVQASGSKISGTFDSIDRSTAKSIANFAKVTVAMAAMQSALQDIGSNGKKHLSTFSIALEGGASALTKFLFIAGSMPNALGLGLGAVAAGVSLFGSLSKAIEESVQQMNRVDAAVKAAQARVAKAGGKADATEQLGGAEGSIERKINAATEALEKQNEAVRTNEIEVGNLDLRWQSILTKQEKVARELRELGERRDKGETIFSQESVDGITTTTETIEQHIQKLIKVQEDLDVEEGNVRNSIKDTKHALDEQRKSIEDSIQPILNLKKALGLAGQQDIAGNLARSGEIQSQLAALGVLRPGEASASALQSNRGALDAALKFNQSIRAAADLAGSDTELRTKILSALIPDSYVQQLADKTKEAMDKIAAERAFDGLASGFTNALGQGLEAAIIGGQKPMEALAGFGKQLFGNMIQDLMKNLQTGLSQLLQSSGLGTAGAGAISGLLGIGGLLLSGIGNKSQSSFGRVKSAITSTEATRGVIAGPANIAIAAVGENLQRAMAPVVARLDNITQVLIDIESNTRLGGGAGGPGSLAPAVAVPTDIH